MIGPMLLLPLQSPMTERICPCGASCWRVGGECGCVYVTEDEWLEALPSSVRRLELRKKYLSLTPYEAARHRQHTEELRVLDAVTRKGFWTDA